MPECEYWDVKDREDEWVQFENLRLPEKLSERKKALRELRRIEKELSEQNKKGWLAGTKIENYPMIKLFDGLGAKEYFCDGKELVFFKEVADVNA